MSNFVIFLLIINLVLNIVTLSIVLDMKSKRDTKEDKPVREKVKKESSFGDRLKSSFLDFDYDRDIKGNSDDDDDIWDEPEYRVVETPKADRVERLRKKWEEEDIENDRNILESNIMRDVNEFMRYVSAYNLDILDIKSNKVRSIKYLDNATYFDKEIHKYKPTVKITFVDGTSDLFLPGKFAKVNYNLNVA